MYVVCMVGANSMRWNFCSR